MMNFKLNKKIISFLAICFLLVLPTIALSATLGKYTPMEEIPGFGRPDTYESYIMAIYKFGLWTVGIAAVFMISIGAFMYITSAGNTSTMGKAKDIIFDAIAGVILALISYVLLSTINPNLVNIRSLSQAGKTGTPSTPGSPSVPGTTNGYKKACPDVNSTTPIDYNKAKTDGDIKLSSACNNYNFSNSSGIDPCVLKAMAQMESSCGSNKGKSSHGACGLMQILPSTAKSLDPSSFTGMDDSQICEKLKSDDALSISLAAQYVKSAPSNCTGGDQAAIFAGYNSGYGCTGSACSPQKHALCSSSDCSGAKAFECCKNPGGLDESINYAWNGIGLYNKCKGT